MNFNPVTHHRRSIRLRGTDYSQAGLYFITLVVQNRLHLFGRIENGEMILNHAGHAIEKWYREIEYKYPDKRCHEMIAMPNHFHCIIENVHNGNAPLRTNVNVPMMMVNRKNMECTISNTVQPLAMQWIGLKP